jgi:hypothetical protein
VQAVTVRCEVAASADDSAAGGTALATGSGSGGAGSGTVIAWATVRVLVVQAALPIPRDILLFRPASGALESMRLRVSEAVAAAGVEEALASLAAAINVSLPQAAAIAQTRLIAAAARRLSVRSRFASSAAGAAFSPFSSSVSASTPSSSSSLVVSGSTTMVLLLDTGVGLPFPSLSQLLAQARAEAAVWEAAAAADTAAASVASTGSVDPAAGSATAGGIGAGAAAAVAALGCPPPAGYLPALQALATGVGGAAGGSLSLAVYVGPVRANVSWAAPDGSQIHVQTPTFAQLCGAAAAAAARGGASSAGSGRDCGYHAIRLQYELTGGDDSTPAAAPRQAAAAGAAAGAATVAAVAAAALATNASAAAASVGGGARRIVQAATAGGGGGGGAVGWGWTGDWAAAGPGTPGEQWVLDTVRLPAAPAIACPPWCPSLLPDTALPLAVPAGGLPAATAASLTSPGFLAWMGVLVPAPALQLTPSDLAGGSTDGLALAVPGLSPLDLTALGTGADGGAPAPVGASAGAVAASAAASASSGLYYAGDRCVGYTDYTTGACSNASHPDFSRCAFGSGGDDCRPCPAHAICPGGARAYPAGPGWYTAAESSGVVVACPGPDAAARCLGWDAGIGAVRCGAPYRLFSPRCEACAEGWYALPSGACSLCPASAGFGALARALLLFAGVALGCVAAVLFLTLLLARAVGGTVLGGWQRALDLLAWVVVLLQVLAQVGRTAAPGLPAFIDTLFRLLAAFQFEDVALPSACWRLFAFTAEVAQMSVVLLASAALWAWLLAGTAAARRCQSRRGDAAAAAAAAPATIRCSLCRRRRGEGEPRPRKAPLSTYGPATQQLLPRLLARACGGPHAAARCGSLRARAATVCSAAVVRRQLPTLLFTVCTLLYALVANTVLKLLRCSTVQLSPLAYALLDSDASSAAGGTAPAAAMASVGGGGDSLVSASVLASNPSFVCYEGSHRPAAVLAWVTLLAFTLGYPLWTLLWARRRFTQLARHSMTAAYAAAPVAAPATEPLATPAAGDAGAGGSATAHGRAATRPPASAAGAWDSLAATDRGANAALLSRAPVLGRALLCLCGRDRTMRAFAGGLRAAKAASLQRRVRSWLGRSSAVCPPPNAAAADRVELAFSVAGAPAAASTAAADSTDSPNPVASDCDPLSVAAPAPASARATAPASPVRAASAGGSSAAGGRGGAQAAPAAVPGCLRSAALDACPALLDDPGLRHFASCYRPAAFHLRQVDMVLLSALAALQIYWPQPQTAAEVGVRASMNVALLVGAAWYFGTRDPFLPHDAWKLYVKVGSLLLAALAAVLMHLSLSMSLTYGAAASSPDESDAATEAGGGSGRGSGSDGLAAAIEARHNLSIAVCAGCALLAATLVLGFWRSTIAGVRRELRGVRAATASTLEKARRAAVSISRGDGGSQRGGVLSMRGAGGGLGAASGSRRFGASTDGRAAAFANGSSLGFTGRRGSLALNGAAGWGSDGDCGGAVIVNPLRSASSRAGPLVSPIGSAESAPGGGASMRTLRAAGAGACEGLKHGQRPTAATAAAALGSGDATAARRSSFSPLQASRHAASVPSPRA